MPIAEIIAIGTELLLGEITDTNSQYLARQLRDCGIDHYRNTTVGDNLQRIAALMREALSRSDFVITTGGLGPTVDDPTREAAALAFDTHNEFHPELWEQIQQRFMRRAMSISENNKKQAMIPAGAVVIENPVGTAPSFILTKDEKTLVCLPGVPREMEYLMQNAVIPWIKQHYPLAGLIKARVIHVGAVSESRVDELVGDLETMTNPSVGLLAHPGIVDIRITAKAQTDEIADQMIAEIETTVRQRLGKDIFGVDDETYISVIHKAAERLSHPIHLIHEGFATDAFHALSNSNITVNSLPLESAKKISPSENTLVFTCRYSSTPEAGHLECDYQHQGEQATLSRDYAGATGLREEWARNYCLNFIRLQLIEKIDHEENHE